MLPPSVDGTLPSPVGLAIPGLVFRRFRDADDYEALARLERASNAADGIEYAPSAENLRNDMEHTAHFDPRLDVILAEAAGETIGFGQVVRQVRDGIAVYYTFGTVLPRYRRHGLGRRIVRANEARGREIAAAFDDEGGRAFGSWADDKQSGANELLLSEGYRPVRYGVSMRRDHLADVPDVPLPSPLELRPVVPEHHRAIFDANAEAFRDHWGHREPEEEDFVSTFSEPDLDTRLWRVAWDGDEVAGVVMTHIWRSENEALGVRRGWLERISVRRPWRRKGVARALIASALIGLRDEGMEDAMLGVDTENVTGAVGLYESLGFRPVDRSTQYRKDWAAQGA